MRAPSSEASWDTSQWSVEGFTSLLLNSTLPRSPVITTLRLRAMLSPPPPSWCTITAAIFATPTSTPPGRISHTCPVFLLRTQWAFVRLLADKYHTLQPRAVCSDVILSHGIQFYAWHGCHVQSEHWGSASIIGPSRHGDNSIGSTCGIGKMPLLIKCCSTFVAPRHPHLRAPPHVCRHVCHAHALPCLSTGWVLNRHFDLSFGTAAVLAQGGRGGGDFEVTRFQTQPILIACEIRYHSHFVGSA